LSPQVSDIVLEARGVGFTYAAEPVLQGVSLAFEQGEFFGLAGPNGAGKSTLLNLLTGVLTPREGSVALRGTPVVSMRRREIEREIALVPQKTGTAFPFSVLEMVLMGRQPFAGFAALDSPEDYQIAGDSLKAVGIEPLAAKMYDELSGGEQQLVLLARALAQKARILLLDEPVSFLDLRHQWEVLSLLARLRDEGLTVIATFHDLNAASRWCSRMGLLRAGRLVACGAPAEVMSAPQLSELYGIPLVVEQAGEGRVRVEFP
jgi:iron complex transport system ATP-binding protein